MTVLDFCILIWLATSLISGLKWGFIYKSGTVIGFLFGVICASRWTPPIAELFDFQIIGTVLVFILVLELVSKLFGLIAILINKIFKIIAIIPFLKTFNRIFGGILSVIISCFVISIGLFIIDTFSHGGEASTYIHKSNSAESLMKLSIFYQPLLSSKLEDFFNSIK